MFKNFKFFLLPGLALLFLAGCVPFLYRPDYNASNFKYKPVLDLFDQNRTELGSGIRYKKILHGSVKKRAVAITFDRGPHPFYTPQILKILNASKVKATFFVIGEQARRYPQILRQAGNDGHEIEISSFHPVDLTQIPENEVEVEIEASGQAVQSLTGRHPLFFRPPGGIYNYTVISTAQGLGYITALWTNNFESYLEAGQNEISLRDLKEIKEGAILLFLESDPATLKILPRIITYLQEKNLKIVTVEQMKKELAKEKD